MKRPVPGSLIPPDAERCANCAFPLVERSPNSPAVRYCEPCWLLIHGGQS